MAVSVSMYEESILCDCLAYLQIKKQYNAHVSLMLSLDTKDFQFNERVLYQTGSEKAICEAICEAPIDSRHVLKFSGD